MGVGDHIAATLDKAQVIRLTASYFKWRVWHCKFTTSRI